MNFYELDLHSPPDKRARSQFRDFMKRIVEVKEDYPDKEFMLVGAGNQAFVAMESFDFVSTSMTGIDKAAPFSIKRGFGYWYDERLMFACPPEDRGEIDRNHCRVCATIQPADFESSRLRQLRRLHRTYDLDKVSRELRNAVKGKNVGLYFKRKLAASEFSGFQMMLQSP